MMSLTKLNQSNYYSNNIDQQYMSVSQMKNYMKCEAAAQNELLHPTSKDDVEALLVGNFLHSYFESEQAHTSFVEEHEQLIKTKSGTLRAPFHKAISMIERLNKSHAFKSSYQGEKEVIVTGFEFGTEWKGKIDCLNVDDGYFVDLKTSQDIHKRFWNNEQGKWQSFIYEYGYDMQMAMYKLLLEKEYDREFQPIIFAVSKEKVPEIMAIILENWQLEEALKRIDEAMPRILEVKYGQIKPERCGRCDFCKETFEPEGFTYEQDLIG